MWITFCYVLYQYVFYTYIWDRDSLLCIASRYGLDGPGIEADPSGRAV
jgi:hypothetical protein